VGLKNMNTKISEFYDYLLTQLDLIVNQYHFVESPERFYLGSMTSFSPVNSDICLSPVS
jgi:hypothetical protein